tara:strand:+ start:376 stop:531 length:156 start_codon:yes stop_codon:yes gene_type:complete
MFGLTLSEMGVNPLIATLILASGLLFVIGFIKSSQENEYKKLMDDFTKSRD